MNVALLSEEASREWPDSGACLCVTKEAANELTLRVEQGVKALPRRGLEIGGLLLGQHTGSSLTVGALFPIPSDYPIGPAYRVDREQLRAAAENVPPGSEIVGMYRSRTDGSLELEDQDEKWIEWLGSHGSAAVVIVRQTRTSPAEARAGFHSKGSLRWFKSNIGLSTWSPIVEQVEPVTAPIAPPAPLPAVIEPIPVVTEKPLRSPMQWTAILAGAAAVMAILMFVNGQIHSPLAPPQQLSVERARTVLEPQLTPPPEPIKPPPTQQVAVQPTQAAITVNQPPITVNQPPVRQFQPPQPKSNLRAAVDPTRVFTPPPDLTAVAATAVSAAPPPGIAPALPSPRVTAPPPEVEFMPPAVARQPRPVIVPPDLRRLLTHEVVLSVKVSVDEAGRVRGIAPTTALTAVEQSFFRLYSGAIQTWGFDPGRRNGRPVAADVILRFRIVPGQ